MDVGWNNCLALMCDSCHTMTGKNKGVISFVKIFQCLLPDGVTTDDLELEFLDFRRLTSPTRYIVRC